MTRQLGQASYITFVKGLNTEAGPLTFPENSTIEDVNCVLTLKGSHKRRYGIKQEINGQPLNLRGINILYEDFKDFSMNTYTWKAPANVGNKTFLVMQVVDKILFYDISNNTALPLTAATFVADLSGIIVDKDLFKETGCSFSSGKGYLFVCGKGLDPCYFGYDNTTNKINLRKIDVRIRDTVGVNDYLDNSEQPKTLSGEHKYNLINQGWVYAQYDKINNARARAKIPILNVDSSLLQYYYIDLYLAGNKILEGIPVSSLLDLSFNDKTADERYNMTVNKVDTYFYFMVSNYTIAKEFYDKSFYGIYYTNSSVISEAEVPTLTDIFYAEVDYTHYLNFAPQSPMRAYYESENLYPSNAQQWFVGRETGNTINVAEVASFDFGNKRAPRGHIILDAFKENRDYYMRVIPPKNDVNRVIDTAFMGGRVFYLRQNSLLYSQVLEDIKQAGMCYTEGDPTSEDSFDVVDTDGGVITITDMGDAIALFELQNGLAVFAKNGIWLVTGVSSDESFKATGYSVRKLSNLECVSKNSIVNVQGAPVFWATSGIYVITQRDYLGYEIQSLSDQTIQSKYVEIPKHNLKNVVGLYNSGAQRAAWFYDVTSESSLAEKTRETKALIYDVRLQAFYELETDKDTEHPFLCNSFNTPYLSFVSLDDEVFDNNGNLVLDNDENIVYTKEAIKNTDLTDVKYLAFNTTIEPKGDYIIYENAKYFRAPEYDETDPYFTRYGWKNLKTEEVLVSIGPYEAKPMIVVRNYFPGDPDLPFYREPERDAGGKYCWVCASMLNKAGWTDSEAPNVGAFVWSSSDGSGPLVGTVLENHETPCLYLASISSGGVATPIGLYDTVIYPGLNEDTEVIQLTSCNFDDTSFKDWGNVNYVSTFTTGANTCGDSFITKDIVYLTTQLSRTEALNLQNNIGNESSCLMQMKWDFEDNEYSHKWTTPVQIYRSRRIFAPGLDTPGFDDIAIRMPVVTTKHKVRGNGRALQIKFSSEEGKNFEVLGWNLIVGARS